MIERFLPCRLLSTGAAASSVRNAGSNLRRPTPHHNAEVVLLAGLAQALLGLRRLALALPHGRVEPVPAEQIAVGNFGVAANGMPFGVALTKGYFKEEGVDVTGIITSAGGGTSLRNMLAGGVPYGEVNPGVVVSAIQQGADLKIISDNVLTVAEFVWATKKDAPINLIKDLKGKKIGYTNPRSTSQGLAIKLVE